MRLPRPAHRPGALRPQEAGEIIAALRQHGKGRSKVLKPKLAEAYGVSVRTIETLARKARALPRKK